MSFTHFDEQGNAVMVDVSEKPNTQREAIAKGRIKVSADCFTAIKEGKAKKGDVLGVARVAGIMATKRTPELIPLCHSLNITKTVVDFELLEDSFQVEVSCTVKSDGKTGVEMEALMGATTALLTIYDMCKAMDKGMVITDVYLSRKIGGKSGLIENKLG